jgi:hypothetical protein
MNSFFEYFYYRVCNVFFKWDGVAGHRAILALTMIQTLGIVDLLLLIFSIFEGRAALFPYSKALGVSTIGMGFLLMIWNSRIYDGRYSEFDARWKDEPENRKLLKGILVLFVFFAPWIGMFLISKLK